MPDFREPAHYHPGKPPFRMSDAAANGMLIVVKCYRCRRCVHYLATDLVLILNPDLPARRPFMKCGRCKTM
jgi:hypothetical protein